MFDTDTILLTLQVFFSMIGIAYFSHGRKGNPLYLVAGFVLLVFPFFIDSLRWTFVIGFALIALPYFLDT